MTILTHNAHDEEARRIMSEREIVHRFRVQPGLNVAIEDSLNILLEVTTADGSEVTSRSDVLSDIDRVKDMLDRAREYVTIREAVMADWKDDPEQGRSILSNMYPEG